MSGPDDHGWDRATTSLQHAFKRRPPTRHEDPDSQANEGDVHGKDPMWRTGHRPSNPLQLRFMDTSEPSAGGVRAVPLPLWVLERAADLRQRSVPPGDSEIRRTLMIQDTRKVVQ